MTRNSKSFVAAFFFFFVLIGNTVTGQELQAIQTIGMSEDDLILFHPRDIVWAPSGNAYVLNEGNCTIVVFSQDWQQVTTFGIQGDGPGEINHPSMLLIVGQELWVKEITSAEIFDLQGNYLRTQQLPHQVSSLKSHDKGFVGIGAYTEGCGIRLDNQCAVVSFFGQQGCSIKDLTDLARAAAWLVFPQDGGQCALLNRFDGKAWQIEPDNSSGPAINLKLGKGFVKPGSRFKNVISDVCSSSLGGFFVIHYPSDKKAGHLSHFDRLWVKDTTWILPKDMRPGIVRVSPSGDLCLISNRESILYICELPFMQAR